MRNEGKEGGTEEEDEDEVEGPGKSFLTFVNAPLTPLRSLWASPSYSSLCYARAMRTITLPFALQMFEFNAFLSAQ